MSFEITSGLQHKPYKTVIYGVEGIGKSTLAASFPDPLFIDTEGSTARMNVKRYPKPTSAAMLWDEIVEVIRTKPCKTLVIDTFDWAERLIVQNICDSSQKKSITSFGYGDGFVQLEEQVGRYLNLLQDVIDVAGINVVITAHAQIRAFNQPDADNSYDRYEMKLGNKTTAKTSNMLKEWADMVLFCNYKTYVVSKDDKGKKHKGTGGQRVMYTTHSPAWDAKNRDNLPEELPLSFDGIAHLFKDQEIHAAEERIKQVFGAENVEIVDDTEPIAQPVQVPDTPTIPDANPIESVWQPIPYTPEEVADMEKLPPGLQDLMKANMVHPSEIQEAVTKKGYFPRGMPIHMYDPAFIDGCLIGAWPDVFRMIEEERNLPF